jgi:colanic acid biosynthesis protein WcaH
METIPTADWVKIHRTMPIICVDCVISVEDKILLVKRKREPMKGSWWFPGGRLLRGERLSQAVSRIVKGEININLSGKPVLLGHDETEFEADPFGHGEGTHTVNFVYASKATMLSIMRVVLDENHIAHSTFTFEEIYGSNMHPYVKRFTALAEGVFRQ